MSRVEFFLFRLKLVRPSQSSLFDDGLKRSELIAKVLEERPSFELKNGHQWHIGNLEQIDEDGGYFAIGKTTRSVLETFDEDSGNFRVEQLDTSPYTHVVFDRKIGLLAVAKKAKLSSRVRGIARRIMRLFLESSVISRTGIEVQVDPIADPYDFIESLEAAYAILSFTATFGRPNPFDTAALFQKCNEDLLEAADGEKGKTSISGQDLDSSNLVQITRSVAATGHEAAARVRTGESATPTLKRLRGTPARFEVEEADFDPALALTEARREYANVRGAGDDTVDG